MSKYYVVGNRQRKTVKQGPVLFHEAMAFLEKTDCGYEIIPCNDLAAEVYWDRKEIEKIHCDTCNHDFAIPIELFYSEELPCPYCGEMEDLHDVETVVVFEQSEVKAS